MKNSVILTLLIFAVSLPQFCLKEVAHIPAGTVGSGAGHILCCDTDNNGKNELIFQYVPGPNVLELVIYEYRPTNRYELVWFAEGGQPPPPGGILIGNFAPNDIGDIDRDGLADLVGPNREWVYLGDTAYYFIVSTQESPDSSSLPETLSWFYRYSSNLSGDGAAPFYFPPDLDRDGRGEILFKGPHPTANQVVNYIFENIGNNQNALVFSDTTGPPPYAYAFGDFDLDERMDFVSSNLSSSGRVFLFENTGDNQYEIVYQDTVHRPNGSDVFSGKDLDSDGKPEFLVAFAQNVGGSSFDFYLYMWEMTGNNTYERTLIDVVRSTSWWSRRSMCGDIDGDGIEEIVWSIGSKVFIYKATGNNQFQRLWEWTHPYVSCSQVNIFDMNQNGYNEIVITGWDDTWIYEIEAVRLLNPNGGQNFLPGDSVLIQWQKFTPPRCDSFSLSYTTDNGRTYLPILNSIPSTESTYNWIVPNTPSESCRVKVTAYGPGFQFDESDALFTIQPSGIAETQVIDQPLRLKITPNPSKSGVRFQIQDAGERKLTLKIYNLSGEIVKTFSLTTKNQKLTTFLWDGKDDSGRKLPAGVYVYRLKTTEGISETKEFIILK